MGNQGFFNTVFKSDIFDELSEHNDENIFDYTFILSRLNDKNIGQFVEYYKKTIDEIKGTTNGVDLPFDFKSNFKDDISIYCKYELSNFIRMSQFARHCKMSHSTIYASK